MKKLMLMILVILPVMAIGQGNKICTIMAQDIIFPDSNRELFEKTTSVFGFIEEVDDFLIIHNHWKEGRRFKQMKFKIVEKKSEGNTVNYFLITPKKRYAHRRLDVEFLKDEVRVILTADDTIIGFKGRR